MVSLLLAPGLPRRILPFAVFLTAFTVVMTILFLSFDLKGPKHRELFNFTQDLDFSSVAQDNPQFIAYVRAVHLLLPPALERSAENLVANHQSLLVASLLDNKVNGSFVEAGAGAGGTEWLERALGWRGLLVQPDPRVFLALRRRTRNGRAAAVHACLSPTPYPKEITLRQLTAGDDGLSDFTRVKCFPLFSLLLAARMTQVDYLSLDADGAEVQVLKTLPFERVDINIVRVEKKADPTELYSFMAAHRYDLVHELSNSYVFKFNRRNVSADP